MEKNKYQKLTDERNLIMKKLTSDNRYLMDEIIRNPTTDISTLAWERISMKLATLINTAKQLKDLENSMVMNRIIDAKKSNQVLGFGSAVIVKETNRFGVVTFIDSNDKTVYLDNDEAPICQLDENDYTDVIRLATQEEILSIANSNKSQDHDQGQ